nr:hypothetical protein CFP56_38708 [Quercus suber]
MSVLDDGIHLSELETGLSYRDESWAQEVTSSSQPFKALEIVCSLNHYTTPFEETISWASKEEMTTCFSIKKLAEMKEKKDENIPEEGGFISKRCRLEKKEKNNVVEKPKLEVALGKIEEAQVQSVVDFKKSDKYDDKLCVLYVEGFDLVCTYMKKHHPEIDLSILDIEEEDREVVVDWAVAVNANDAIDGEIDAPTDDPIDPAQP